MKWKKLAVEYTTHGRLGGSYIQIECVRGGEVSGLQSPENIAVPIICLKISFEKIISKMMKLEKLTLPHRASRDTSKGARTLEEISPGTSLYFSEIT